MKIPPQRPCILVGSKQWERLRGILPLLVDTEKQKKIGELLVSRGFPVFEDRTLEPDDAFAVTENGIVRLAGRSQTEPARLDADRTADAQKPTPK